MDKFQFRASIGLREISDSITVEHFKELAEEYDLENGEREDESFAITLWVTPNEIISNKEEASEEEDAEQVTISISDEETGLLDAGTFNVGHNRILAATELLTKSVIESELTGRYIPHYLITFPDNVSLSEMASLFNASLKENSDGEIYFGTEFDDYVFQVFEDGTITPLHEHHWDEGKDISTFISVANRLYENNQD